MGAAPRYARPFVAIFIGMVVVCALAPLNLWPFSNWELFSRLRGPVESYWEAVVEHHGVVADYTIAPYTACAPLLRSATVRFGRSTDVRIYHVERLLSDRTGPHAGPPSSDARRHVHGERRTCAELTAGSSRRRTRGASPGFASGSACCSRTASSAHDYDVLAARHVPFLPHFYMDVFAHMPSPDLASTLQALGIAAALAAGLGLALRITLPVAFGCGLILNGMLNSTGRVMVRDALLMLCLAVIVAAGRAAGDVWAWRAPKRTAFGERYGWPIRSAMIVIALAYFFASFQKWRYSGFAWVTSDNLRWILYAQPHPNGFALFIADRPLLAHLFAAGALLLETFFPLVIFVPETALASHPCGDIDARGDSHRAWPRLFGAMADRSDRVCQLARRRRLDAPRTGTHSDRARGRSLSPAEQSVLLYDEDCGFCRWSLDKILAWDRAKRVRPVAIQSEEGSRLLASIASRCAPRLVASRPR